VTRQKLTRDPLVGRDRQFEKLCSIYIGLHFNYILCVLVSSMYTIITVMRWLVITLYTYYGCLFVFHNFVYACY